MKKLNILKVLKGQKKEFLIIIMNMSLICPCNLKEVYKEIMYIS